MANLKSFDSEGLRGKLRESRDAIEQYLQTETCETERELFEFLEAVDLGVSAAIEMVLRGEASPEQEQALYAYLKKNGVIN
jgi:hypothetical protein